jgi:transposase
VTPANEQDRAQVAELAEQVQSVTEGQVELAFVDQGYTGEQPAAAAQAKGIRLDVVKLPEARKGFVRLPRRWVVIARTTLLSLASSGRLGSIAAVFIRPIEMASLMQG